VSFAVHLLLFQLIDHTIHGVQHNLRWRRQLHALHHRQRQMMLWLDSRKHLLDDLLHDSLYFVSGLLLGVGPAQFVARMACKKLVESLLHANLRMNFVPVLGRLLVSPQFHRLRHATAFITPSAWAMNCAVRAAWGAATARCCSRSGTCCFAAPAGTTPTRPPACATNGGVAAMAAVSGPSSGWA